MVEDKKKDKTIIAMENPVSAVFDLTDKISHDFPRINNGIQATFIFGLVTTIILSIIYVALIIKSIPPDDLVMILSSFSLFILFIVLAALLLNSYMKWTNLLRFFTRRYNAILAVRYSDPIVPISPGKTLIDRYLTHLWYSYPKFQWFLENNPNAVQIKSNPNNQNHYFDAYLRQKPELMWRLFRLGNQGYGFYIKTFNHIPSIEELKVLERNTQEISKQVSIPPSRSVALFQMESESGEINQKSYDYLINHSISVDIRGKKFKCPMQAVIEMKDNTYDFIPLIPTIPGELP